MCKNEANPVTMVINYLYKTWRKKKNWKHLALCIQFTIYTSVSFPAWQLAVEIQETNVWRQEMSSSKQAPVDIKRKLIYKATVWINNFTYSVLLHVS